mgnify:CR=1 FL=1
MFDKKEGDLRVFSKKVKGQRVYSTYILTSQPTTVLGVLAETRRLRGQSQRTLLFMIQQTV